MKKYKILLPLLLSFFGGSSFIYDNENRVDDEDTWSGTVNFFNKQTGRGIVLYEWHMDATIKEDTVNSSEHLNFRNDLGDVAECKGQDIFVEKVISIDDEKKEIYIDVPIPPCRGSATTAGVTGPYSATDETGIVITKQPLGNNPNVITGTLVFNDPDATGSSVTTYKWNLIRNVRKKN
jgi:hypothetical protein